MSQNEVQANSVIYSRKDYIMLLEEAQAAFAVLAKWRQIEIDAWVADTEARENDLRELFSKRFTRGYEYKFERQLEAQTKSARQTLFDIIRRRPQRTVFDTIEEYAAHMRGMTLEQYIESEQERLSAYCGDTITLLRWLSHNGHAVLDNEWRFGYDTVTRKLAEVSHGNLDAQFVIPRSEFDDYMAAMLLVEKGSLPKVYQTLHVIGDYD